MFLVPIPLILIGWLVYRKKYKLTGQAFEEMKASLDYGSKD